MKTVEGDGVSDSASDTCCVCDVVGVVSVATGGDGVLGRAEVESVDGDGVSDSAPDTGGMGVVVEVVSIVAETDGVLGKAFGTCVIGSTATELVPGVKALLEVAIEAPMVDNAGPLAVLAESGEFIADPWSELLIVVVKIWMVVDCGGLVITCAGVAWVGLGLGLSTIVVEVARRYPTEVTIDAGESSCSSMFPHQVWLHAV